MFLLSEKITIDWALKEGNRKIMKGKGLLVSEITFLIKKFNIEDEIEFVRQLKLLEKDFNGR